MKAARKTQVLTFISIAMIFLSILWRFYDRGDYVPGWDLLGQAQGQYFLETQGFSGLFKQAFNDTHHYQYWTPISSVIFTFIPGQLGRWFPGLHWGGMLNLFVFILLLLLIIQIAGLTKREIPFLLLAIASSPALLSFSIVNFPWTTGCLPHLLVLGMLYSRWFRERPLMNLFAGAAIAELSLHLYPLGRSFFINILLFVFFDRSAKLKLRAAWIVTSLVGLWFTYLVPGQMNAKMVLSWNHFSAFWPVFKNSFIDGKYDHSLVLWLGLLSCCFVKRDKIAVGLMFIAQWWLILALASGFNIAEIRTRRLLVVEIYGLVLFCFVLRDRAKWFWKEEHLSRWGKVLLTVLMFGTAYQVYALYKFTKISIDSRRRPLPYVESEADYFIAPVFQNSGSEIIKRVREGKIIILLYDYISYPENTTDPIGLLERLYLKLGHKIFSEKILIFCTTTQRYSRVPILNPTDFTMTIKKLKLNEQWDKVEVWNFLEDVRNHVKTEHPELMQTLEKNFEMIPSISPFKQWGIFRLKDYH